MQAFEVFHVTNVSTGEGYVAGTVKAHDYEDAHDRAAESGLAPLYQTYRLRSTVARYYVEMGHPNDPCRVYDLAQPDTPCVCVGRNADECDSWIQDHQ